VSHYKINKTENTSFLTLHNYIILSRSLKANLKARPHRDDVTSKTKSHPLGQMASAIQLNRHCYSFVQHI